MLEFPSDARLSWWGVIDASLKICQEGHMEILVCSSTSTVQKLMGLKMHSQNVWFKIPTRSKRVLRGAYDNFENDIVKSQWSIKMEKVILWNVLENLNSLNII